MPLAEILTQVIKFFVVNFGNDILVVGSNKLKGYWAKSFATSNLMILGAKATGKSSLVYFLTEETPYTVVDGEKVTPDPTGMGVSVGKKVTLSQNDWHKLKQDFPGEAGLRHTWKQGIEDFNPDGIVYMMNGQRMVNDVGIDQEVVMADVAEMFQDVLSCYSDNLRNLKSICICINYKDKWAHNPSIERSLVRGVEDAVEARQDANSIFTPLKVRVHATQLSPKEKEWKEAKQAMAHLGADLMA